MRKKKCNSLNYIPNVYIVCLFSIHNMLASAAQPYCSFPFILMHTSERVYIWKGIAAHKICFNIWICILRFFMCFHSQEICAPLAYICEACLWLCASVSKNKSIMLCRGLASAYTQAYINITYIRANNEYNMFSRPESRHFHRPLLLYPSSLS